MGEIGIRELKQRATQIMRDVREKRETYTITYQGRPCGLLIPYSTTQTKGTKKRKGKAAGLASLRGILKDGPEVSWEEFQAVKKEWDAHVDALVEELKKEQGGKET